MDSLASNRDQQDKDIIKLAGVHPYFRDVNIHQKDIREKKTWQNHLYD